VKHLLLRLVVLCGMCFLFLALADPRARSCTCQPKTKPDCNTDCINALNYCVQNPNGHVANAYFSENCAQQLFHSVSACDALYCNYCQQVGPPGCGGGL
jgi:hypothetical protein